MRKKEAGETIGTRTKVLTKSQRIKQREIWREKKRKWRLIIQTKSDRSQRGRRVKEYDRKRKATTYDSTKKAAWKEGKSQKSGWKGCTPQMSQGHLYHMQCAIYSSLCQKTKH